MKKIILFSAFFILLFSFSCATKPETEDQTIQEISEAVQKPEDEADGEPIEEISDSSDEFSDEIPEEAITEINEEETDVLTETGEEETAEQEFPSGYQDEIIKAGINELPQEFSPVYIEEPPVIPPQTAQVTEPPQPEPPAEERLSQTEPPLPTAPESPPRRPPVPPPALLGPAEEIPKEPETPPAKPAPQLQPPAPLPDIPFTPAPLPRDEEIVFSRTVRAAVGQTIEIPFRGTGWVYLGELASRRGILYNSRRLDPEGQSFIFRAEEAGTYALKFSKQDFIRDIILNDHVQVIVGEAPESSAGWFNPPRERDRAIAEPRWPSLSEEGRSKSEERAEGKEQRLENNEERVVTMSSAPAPDDARQSRVEPQPSQKSEGSPSDEHMQHGVAQEDSKQDETRVEPSVRGFSLSSAPVEEQTISQPKERLPADVIMQRAREAFDSGEVAAAIMLLDQYREYYPGGTDELYWYYGQFYEANSPSRNILLSLEYYRRLTNEFPQSARFNDARRRIAYLERFYINIQ